MKLVEIIGFGGENIIFDGNGVFGSLVVNFNGYNGDLFEFLGKNLFYFKV